MIEVTEEHLKIIKQVARKLTRVHPIQDSEEYADGLLGLITFLPQFDSAKGKISTWLHFKLKFFIIDQMRIRNKRRACQRIEFHPLPDFENYKGYWDSEEFETIELLRTAISHLPKFPRQVFELRSQGLTASKIAAKLGVSESYAWVTLNLYEPQLKQICERLLNPPTITEHLRASEMKPPILPPSKKQRVRRRARA